MELKVVLHLQSMFLSETLRPVLQRLHPDGQYLMGGRDCKLIWNPAAESGQRAHISLSPGWFYIPQIPPRLNDKASSYALWKGGLYPLIVLELATGDGTREHDRTPMRGKCWIYEQMLQVRYYGIYQLAAEHLEMYHLVEGNYVPLSPNERNRYSLQEPGVELGIWQGYYRNAKRHWLRWWAIEGDMLLTGPERADQERHLVEQEQVRAERLAALLRSLSDTSEQEEP